MKHKKCTGLGEVLRPGHASMQHVWNTVYVLVWVEFWEQDMLNVWSTGNVLVWVEFETRIFKHVACVEQRKCTGLG